MVTSAVGRTSQKHCKVKLKAIRGKFINKTIIIDSCFELYAFLFASERLFGFSSSFPSTCFIDCNMVWFSEQVVGLNCRSKTG